MKMKLSRAAGFTLLELLVALGIASALMSVAVPTFMAWLPTLHLSSATQQVAADLKFARGRAISQNTSYQVSFNGSSYVVQKCAGSCVNEGGDIALPSGITVSASGTPQFLPRGTSTGNTVITLSNGGEARQVIVSLVGRVTVL